MAGIEINGNKVLRTGVQAPNSMNRGFSSVSSNHISGLQSPTIDSMALTSGIRGYTPRSQQYNPGGGVQTLPRNPLDNNIHHSNTQTLPNRSSSHKLGNQLSSSPVPATSHQQILLQQKISHQHKQQLTHQQLAQQQQQLMHQQQLSQHQHQLSQQHLVQHQQQHHIKQLSQQQLASQQMTSQQLLQQQILLRQLKPQTPPQTSQQNKHPNVLPGMNSMNSRNSMNISLQQSMVPKPVSKAEQQPKSYKQTPTTSNKQQPQSSTQATDGSNYLQALASISNQLPNKRPLLNSGALSQLSAVTNQPAHSPTQLLDQAFSKQEQQEHQQLSKQVSSIQQQQQEQLSKQGISIQQQEQVQLSKQAVTLQQQQQEQLQLSKQAVSLQQQQEQLQQILEQQRIKDEEMLMAKLQGVRLDTQNPQSQTGEQGSDRTYMNVQPVAAIGQNVQPLAAIGHMNVQPVAAIGRGGKILNQPEIDQNVPVKGPDGGKKAPAIPKSQEVKHKKEPLYSTILQFNNNNNDANKINGMQVFDDGVYANYAPASLYSNYSNYSELEALRSTDSQCSADEEPTVGLPNLDTDSPTSSSYSELRQAGGGARVTAFNGDGSIYEPVLPPKGIPGPNSIHFKSLSGGSTDSDYFGSCVKCGSKIVGDGSGCSAMGRLFHVQCFTCTECNIILQGLPFYAVEGSPLCETDYLNTLEKCCKCYQPILDRILRATGKPYHPTCFTCVACHKSLDGIPFTVDATNQIHCIEDFHKRFAPRCSVCKDPIMPTPGEEETVRVVALDRSFHINCYRCVDCNLLLSSDEDGRGCYPLDDTVLCRQCNTTRIQRLTSSIAQD